MGGEFLISRPLELQDMCVGTVGDVDRNTGIVITYDVSIMGIDIIAESSDSEKEERTGSLRCQLAGESGRPGAARACFPDHCECEQRTTKWSWHYPL